MAGERGLLPGVARTGHAVFLLAHDPAAANTSFIAFYRDERSANGGALC